MEPGPATQADSADEISSITSAEQPDLQEVQGTNAHVAVTASAQSNIDKRRSAGESVLRGVSGISRLSCRLIEICRSDAVTTISKATIRKPCETGL